MSMLTHPVIPMVELTRGLSPEAQDLAIRAITTALNRAHYLDELQDAARNASAAVERLEHDHEPMRRNADPCRACAAEEHESRVLCRVDGVRSLLKNGGRA